MQEKKTLCVFLMLVLLLLSVGCDGGSSTPKNGPYKGSARKLEGTYQVDMTGEKHTPNPLRPRQKETSMERGNIKITMQDPKTLEMSYEPTSYYASDESKQVPRKPFKLDYDKKTGKATGKDDEGYEWEIEFAVRADSSGQGDDRIIMEHVRRKWDNWMGAYDWSSGSSMGGIPYDKPKENKNDKTNKTNKTNNKK